MSFNMACKKATGRKPDSVVGYHLSVTPITWSDRSAYPSALNEPFFPGNAGALTYVAFQHARFTRMNDYS